MDGKKIFVKRVGFVLSAFAFLALLSGTFSLRSEFRIGLGGVARAAEDDVREWTDSTGKFKVQATLVSHDEKNVSLRKTDNRVVKLPLTKLSEEDQAYIASLDEDPFAGGVLDEVSDSGDAQTSSGSFRIKGKTHRFATCPTPVYLGDQSGVQPMFLTSSASWKLEPSTSTAKDVGTVRSVPVCNKDRVESYAHNLNLIGPDADSSTFYLSYNVGTLDKTKNYLERCDVSKGASEIAEAPGGVDVLFQSVSPDGKYIAAIMGLKPESGGFAKKALVAIFALDSFSSKGEFKPCALFCPALDEKRPDIYAVKELESVQWVDNERVLLLIKGDSVTLWNLTSCKAEYSLKGGGDCKLDPSRKFFYVSTKDGVSFYDASNGDPLGALDFSTADASEDEFSSLFEMRCAYSPKGDRIAVRASSKVFIFDLTTGKCKGGFPGRFTTHSPVWTDENSIIIDHDLYDVASGLPVCTYDNIANDLDSILYYGGLTWCVCGGIGNEAALVGYKLPHPKAAELIKNLDVEKMFSVYPGMGFSIKLDLHGLLNESEVQSFLEEALVRNGMKYDPKSKYVLKASCVDTKREEETVYGTRRTIGRLPVPLPGSGQALGTIKLKVFEESLSISDGNKELWSFGQETTGPRNVEYDPDKKLEDSLRESNKPEINFFKFAAIPQYVSKAGRWGTLTSAQIEAGGIRDRR
ncbi:MAG: hypothetical protein IJM54_09720 [Thermoguttaceae bacterium]|nr:hypothetical protein [Thermoguttaceae bacterium]